MYNSITYTDYRLCARITTAKQLNDAERDKQQHHNWCNKQVTTASLCTYDK